ncbi:hypothetical protein WISP_78996 [Willisornis vidua]|uniref:Phosphatidylinositol-specific phospholipase C X domain-containing protein n=1 Tax=Willisornis vidua TaxID=1566151 RepID=A0ABQ9DAP0_9PASS|nr:hypothetical protein WISP_78996 [Willisornis vidua]
MASSQGKNELVFADWMAALPSSLHSTPLTNLAIPVQARYFDFPDSRNLTSSAFPSKVDHMYMMSRSGDHCEATAGDTWQLLFPFLERSKEYIGTLCGTVVEKVEKVERDGEGVYRGGYATEHNQLLNKDNQILSSPLLRDFRKIQASSIFGNTKLCLVFESGMMWSDGCPPKNQVNYSDLPQLFELSDWENEKEASLDFFMAVSIDPVTGTGRLLFRSLLYSKLSKPSYLSLSSEERFASPLIIFMALLWTLSSWSMSFLCWGSQKWMQHCRLPVSVSQKIKGSHDSFSFYIDEASPVGPEQPETVQNFVSVFGTVAKKLMRKWLATQTMNFTSQLGAGIRYFDLRISTKPRDPDNELYFAHGLFSAKVKEGLEEINAFLSEHPKEVVFLDFNHFYGMQKCHHEKLVQMLKDTYGNKMCPAIFAHEVTLQYLWEKEHQVLVFYHSPVAVEVAFLWPGQMMPAPWANTTDPEKLIQFLQASITERRKKGSFFISQVVLTPKASTVVKGVASGLRETITESPSSSWPSLDSFQQISVLPMLRTTKLDAELQPLDMLIPGVALTQVQDLAFGLAELHEVWTGPAFQPVQMPLDGIPSLQCVNCTTQFGVISELAEGTLDPTVHVTIIIMARLCDEDLGRALPTLAASVLVAKKADTG